MHCLRGSSFQMWLQRQPQTDTFLIHLDPTHEGIDFSNKRQHMIRGRDYSNTERILAATGFTPLLVDLERKTAKPRARTAACGNSRRPCIILYIQIRSPRNLFRTRENGRSRWGATSYGTWRIPFTNFIASF